MKATDLMIGDWVKCYSSNCGGHRVDFINEMDDEIGIDGEIFDLNRLNPIPLTPEILAKNGLEKRCSDELVLFDNSKIDTTGEYFIIRYFVNTQRLWLCKGIGVDENEIRINCQYVHELQHALKLCGIDKQIVL